MTFFLSLALATLGLNALALALDRHRRQWSWLETRSANRTVLRFVGVTSLLGSLMSCWDRAGWGVGTVEWFALISAASLGVTLSLAALSHHVRRKSANRNA